MSILQGRFYNKNVVVSPSCLGPFPVSAITDHVRGRLVAQQGHPVILQDGTRFAVLAPPGKDLRIVCAGCFTPNMSLWDDSRCKKVSSYSQHWDVRRGERKECCKAVGYDTLENCQLRVNAIKDEEIEDTDPIDSIFESINDLIDMLGAVITTEAINSNGDMDNHWKMVSTIGDKIKQLTKLDKSRGDGSDDKVHASTEQGGLMEVPTKSLIDELKRRNELDQAASWIETDDIAVIARDRGIKLLIDGRFEDLEAEMRRVSDPSRPTVEGYYFTEKRDGAAHVTDAPLATMETFQDLISAEDMAIIKAKRARGIGPAPPLCHPYGTRPGTKRYKLRKLKDSRTQGF